VWELTKQDVASRAFFVWLLQNIHNDVAVPGLYGWHNWLSLRRNQAFKQYLIVRLYGLAVTVHLLFICRSGVGAGGTCSQPQSDGVTYGNYRDPSWLNGGPTGRFRDKFGGSSAVLIHKTLCKFLTILESDEKILGNVGGLRFPTPTTGHQGLCADVLSKFAPYLRILQLR